MNQPNILIFSSTNSNTFSTLTNIQVSPNNNIKFIINK